MEDTLRLVVGTALFLVLLGVAIYVMLTNRWPWDRR